MRQFFIAVGLAAILAGFTGVPAQAQSRRPTLGDRAVPGYSQRDVHDPYSRGYADFLPAAPRQHGYGGHRGGYSYRDHDHGGHGHGGYGHGGYGQGRRYNYSWREPYFDYDPYGHSDYHAHYHYPSGYYGGYPLILSARDLIGSNLGSAWNPFAGTARPSPQVNIYNIEPLDTTEPRVERPRVRVANAESVARAWRFINLGDKHFQEQQYRKAYQRYQDASKAAPDLVEAYLRQGQAMLAGAQYEVAARAFKRGLKLETDVEAANFELDKFYGPNKIAKAAHIEALASATEDDPRNADLVLLVGLELYLDAEKERAAAFLLQAATMLEPGDGHLATILRGMAAVDGGADAPNAAPAAGANQEAVEF